jgi:hypothetical protein
MAWQVLSAPAEVSMIQEMSPRRARARAIGSALSGDAAQPQEPVRTAQPRAVGQADDTQHALAAHPPVTPHDGAVGRAERGGDQAGIERMQSGWEFFVQTSTRASSRSTATPRPAAPTSVLESDPPTSC